jgi:hypothetical protein
MCDFGFRMQIHKVGESKRKSSSIFFFLLENDTVDAFLGVKNYMVTTATLCQVFGRKGLWLFLPFLLNTWVAL